MDPERSKKLKGKGIRAYIKDVNSENLLTNIGQVGFSSTIMGVLNMFIQLLLTRKLGPSLYGEVETLLTINSMILIGVASVALILTRFISFYKTRQQFDKMKFIANWAFTFFLLIGIALFCVSAIYSKILANFLNIKDYTILIVFGMLTAVTFIVPIIEGILKGLQEFKLFGRYKIVESLARLILVAIFLFLGFKTKAILVAFLLGSVITIIFSWRVLKKMYINKPYRTSTKEFYKFAFPVMIACFGIASLSNIDLVLVRHFFDPETVGHYAAAGLLAKLTFGMAFGSASVMFPKIVEEFSNGNNEEVRKILKNTLKITVITSGIMAAILSTVPNFISGLLFGPEYKIGGMMVIYSWSFLFLSVVTILATHDLATKRYGFVGVLIVGAVIQIYQIIASKNSIMGILWTLLIVNFMLMLIILIKKHKEILAKE